METYAQPSVKQTYGVCRTTGNSNQASLTTQRGGMGWEVGGRFKREGTYVDLWLICVDVWQKSTILQSNYPSIKNKL